MKRRISILGATGSVGKSTLDLILRSPERFDVIALTAQTNVPALAEAARATQAKLAVVADPARLDELRNALSGTDCKAAAGADGLAEAATGEAELVMAAIVGCAGLLPTMAAVEAGKTVALANKEALVTAGHLMIDAAAKSGATLLPVDSEHNAIFQCLATSRSQDVARLVLTASGGPFRTATRAELRSATPAQAVAHPKWSMGSKISVDSATLMNKGLELIEAHYLFALPSEQINIVIHPQSIVHSLVEFVDGSMLAQLGSADMRIPIAYALAWPERMETPAAKLDLIEVGRLDFEAPDLDRFPALRLARRALEAGDGAAVVLNAANEIAVELFLAGQIGFTEIPAMVERALDATSTTLPRSIAEVTALDAAVRRDVRSFALERCA
ncbi:1-deoxy-D-xylulose-5-phosphate reductoisomerase [Sphingomonas sinipercae]|uniref:1-deoxy-D-xylulose 5-phosphate reductoisomerase n=1 Tax=Sphingomonas sinipercae TaxID=2714944 RepID=A0A6G7ZNM1_9SPHN|nr:1-deoxy-D-xylulose-5-phosphate reductoisomerase [Sphingomonas sinipercae]QIL02525.1 1-deoxy-D-xylulose-5-phosphate reductoisomerase [Sphingomonas sinipercae]